MQAPIVCEYRYLSFSISMVKAIIFKSALEATAASLCTKKFHLSGGFLERTKHVDEILSVGQV